MAPTLLTGATGTLGSELRPRLREAGHEVRAASRSPPRDEGEAEWVSLDLATGTGLEAAVDEVDVIVHAASDVRRARAVDVRGTRRLLTAAADADVDHLVYVSIVGIDEIPYSYYEAKLAAERAVEASDVPSTTIRLTQFHPFVAMLLDRVARLPVWPLPTRFRSQPIDVGEAADAVVARATAEPAGRVPDVGGPEARSLGWLARAYRDVRGLRRPIVRLPVPGAVAGAFRDGRATCPDRDVGTVSWPAWLAETYGD